MPAHLVGDLHQPLHVGAVYIDVQDHPSNPDANGHHFDTTMDTQVAITSSMAAPSCTPSGTLSRQAWPEHIAATMLNDAKAIPPTPGDVTTRAEVWASDTVMVSHAAFKGINTTAQPHWTATFSDRPAYLTTKRDIQAARSFQGRHNWRRC